MNRRTVERLVAVNEAFYSTRATEFDASRRSPWPGWERLLTHVDVTREVSILDVGCGNGRFALHAARQLGDYVDYCGVDFSGRLLDAARARGAPHWRWIEADFVLGPLPAELGTQCFDVVCCFGVMHHVPGEATRRSLLERLVARVVPGGLLLVSFWQFGRRERFLRRVLEWHELAGIGLAAVDETELEAGDYLLRWGSVDDESPSMRYCHFCDPDEADRLTRHGGLERVEAFDADGKSGDLNRYIVLRRG